MTFSIKAVFGGNFLLITQSRFKIKCLGILCHSSDYRNYWAETHDLFSVTFLKQLTFSSRMLCVWRAHAQTSWIIITCLKHFQHIFQINSADRAATQCFSNSFFVLCWQSSSFFLSSICHNIRRYNVQFNLMCFTLSWKNLPMTHQSKWNVSYLLSFDPFKIKCRNNV